MAKDTIVIKGAREHNLKNINLEIPRDKLVVITGVSGSGKSTLAFDTIFAEGQRRYVESLSAYARQFLEQMDKPDVDAIEGLSPAISIEQKSITRNPRSTVATITEIYDYLRLLYARAGTPHCHECGKPLVSQTVQQMVDAICQREAGSRLMIMAPVVRSRKGEYKKLFEDLKKKGFARVRLDGEVLDMDSAMAVKLDKNTKHSIDIVVDRISVKEGIERRVTDSVETALQYSEGLLLVADREGNEVLMSETAACHDCGVSMPELEPRLFSFNAPEGACPNCSGLGASLELDANLIVPNPSLSIAEGAIAPWAHKSSTRFWETLQMVAERYDIDLNKPWSALTEGQHNILLYGTQEKVPQPSAGKFRKIVEARFTGVIGYLQNLFAETTVSYIKDYVQRFMREKPCPACNGERLNKQVLSVLINGQNISRFTAMNIGTALQFATSIHFDDHRQVIAQRILREICERLSFLNDVGLDYLELSRKGSTLSGGEAQRIRLATQIGSKLMGVLYILDEPSIGLHQRDNDKLIATLKSLRDNGNTVIVVEHDEDTIMQSDFVVDMGPFAGRKGGEVVVAGTPAQVMACEASLTGSYLSGRETIQVPARRRSGKEYVELQGAAGNNLQSVDVRIPLETFTLVTGVSGSGKSTLIIDTLLPALASTLRTEDAGGGSPYRSIQVTSPKIKKVIAIDQTPIGRTPRSNPATYTGVFTHIRDLFASAPEAKKRGYKAGRFSFNVKGGRCEACQGDGTIKIEMHFLPDLYVTCETCKGKRFNRDTLDITYKGKSIADMLDMTVNMAAEFFENIPKIQQKLQTIRDVGLGYIKLGQAATTLSGGEAQRVKLSKELSRKNSGDTIYILDEPTTGLHFHDIRQLIEVLNRLVDAGNTVIVIEHNLDMIKCADHIVDLGPEGGNRGGQILFSGTPEGLCDIEASYTGHYLRKLLAKD
ncbi:excinuclease ABC, A subunit [Desulfurispirillum indicum S5]|uniref:UvrABC system protein A n=1 Tax=Desulfurispirillum indicum (strain ATCC BAA-1389 / DSM 22839 / S5) TaxID=653733 RepID=E6W6D9_DESIS|nr:excinuclease ABC subunit UvrA [Desulfurispirillum indicum]ADU67274.1 excinuclease ABC, A subunit [Desulfurispirillum indicum S5]